MSSRAVHGVWSVAATLGCATAALLIGCMVRSPGARQLYRYQWASDDRCWEQAQWQIQARGDDEAPMRYATADGERRARLDYDGCLNGVPLDNALVTDGNVERRLCIQVADHLARLGQQRFRGDSEKRIQECIRGQITEAKAGCILRARTLGEISCGSDGDFRNPAPSRPTHVATADATARPGGGNDPALAPTRPGEGPTTLAPIHQRVGSGESAPKHDLWRPSPKYTPKPDPAGVDKPTTAPPTGHRDLVRLKRACDAGDADACTAYVDNLQDDPAFKAERDGGYLVAAIGASLTACVSVNSGRLVIDQPCVDEARAASCAEVREYASTYGARALTVLSSSVAIKSLQAPLGNLVAQTLTKCR